MNDSKVASTRRQRLQSGKGITPITSASANVSKIPGLHPSAKLQGQNPKSSVYIGDIQHRQNYIPSVEYYAKGPLLGRPEQGSCRNSVDETLTSRKLGPLDPPDRVRVHKLVAKSLIMVDPNPCRYFLLQHRSSHLFCFTISLTTTSIVWLQTKHSSITY